jgi:hypothetical protein
MTNLTLLTESGPINLTTEQTPPMQPMTGAKVVITFADGSTVEATIEGVLGLEQSM